MHESTLIEFVLQVQNLFYRLISLTNERAGNVDGGCKVGGGRDC